MSQEQPELHEDARLMGVCEAMACRAPAYYKVEDRLTGMGKKVCNRHLARMGERSDRFEDIWGSQLEDNPEVPDDG